VGVKLLAILGAAALLSVPVAGSVRYVEGRQAESGGFSEPGRAPDAATTAWAAIGLAAAGGSTEAVSRAGSFLAAHEAEARSDTDAALHAIARTLAGDEPQALLRRLQARRPGRLVNADVWTILALRQAGLPVPPEEVRAVLDAQAPSGGWAWAKGGTPDSNDTAAAIEALRAAGVGGLPIARGLGYLQARQNADGGFELSPGRASDTQSTAWAIQAFLAGGRKPGAAAWRFLARMRRPDGSYRYSARYVTTPVWVTAQTLPALAGKPFPLRR